MDRSRDPASDAASGAVCCFALSGAGARARRRCPGVGAELGIGIVFAPYFPAGCKRFSYVRKSKSSAFGRNRGNAKAPHVPHAEASLFPDRVAHLPNAIPVLVEHMVWPSSFRPTAH